MSPETAYVSSLNSPSKVYTSSIVNLSAERSLKIPVTSYQSSKTLQQENHLKPTKFLLFWMLSRQIIRDICTGEAQSQIPLCDFYIKVWLGLHLIFLPFLRGWAHFIRYGSIDWMIHIAVNVNPKNKNGMQLLGPPSSWSSWKLPVGMLRGLTTIN